MAIAKYESFLSLCRMAPNQLTHLSLASTHRTSIAFFLLIITLFVVPFLSISTSELIPIALPNLAYTLWNSLLGILTSSPFYFFLLNFLIVVLVFLSGILDPSPSGREFNGLQEGDLHQRGLHNFSTAAQIIHERLALDELYESQASSLPYLNVTEISRIYVADDGIIGNGSGDEGEAHDDKGKQTMSNPVASFLPAFSDADSSDTLEEGSSSSRMDTTEEFLFTGGMLGDESDMKKTSPVSSVDLYDSCKDIHAQGMQVYDKNVHLEMDVDADADDKDKGDGSANVINNDHKGGNDVIHGENDNDVIHDEDGDDHVDDEDIHIDHECHGIEAEADTDGKWRQRIARTPSQPSIAGTIHSQEREDVGAETALSGEEGRGSIQEMLGVWSSKGKPLEEGEELMMSREELNERASAFISAFRKKLISTAIGDDASGQM